MHTQSKDKPKVSSHLKDGMGETRDLSTVPFWKIKREILSSLMECSDPVELLAELSLRRNQMQGWIGANPVPRSIHSAVPSMMDGPMIGDGQPVIESSGHSNDDESLDSDL